MKTLKYIKSISLVLLSAGILTTSAICVEKVSATPTSAQPTAQQNVSVVAVSPLTVVANPSAYLNKNILMKAKFHETTENIFMSKQKKGLRMSALQSFKQ